MKPLVRLGLLWGFIRHVEIRKQNVNRSKSGDNEKKDLGSDKLREEVV